MADYFASIFGTEKDKVNCSFYIKIGACRHGDRCSRVHNKPSFSQTVLLQNLYENPRNLAKSKGDGRHISEDEDQKHFDEFFEDIYVELEEKYGPIEEMNVCDNLGDHLIGNVYVKFESEKQAERAVDDLNNRWFGQKPVYAELSTVTDFREAGCRQYDLGACTRGGFCNFMHLKQISNSLRRHLFGSKNGGRSNRHRRSPVGHHRHRSHISRSRSRSPRSPRSPRSSPGSRSPSRPRSVDSNDSRSHGRSSSRRHRSPRHHRSSRHSRHAAHSHRSNAHEKVERRSRTRSRSFSPVQMMTSPGDSRAASSRQATIAESTATNELITNRGSKASRSRSRSPPAATTVEATHDDEPPVPPSSRSPSSTSHRRSSHRHHKSSRRR